jgi:dihydroflavonol-4-reductase
MTVLVTGASGHVGGNLVRALLREGRTVRALVHHDTRAFEGLDPMLHQGDICNLEDVRAACRGVDVVYHLAAVISLSSSPGKNLRRVNVDGTRNVVRACLEQGVRRLIHMSSIHALNQHPLDTPVDESRGLLNAAHDAPYDASKAEAEQQVWAGVGKGLDAVVLNPTGMIGPHDYRPSHFGEVLWALARGRLPALVAGGFDWVDVRDVCKAAMGAEKRAGCGQRYLLSGEWHSLAEMAALVARVSGVQPPHLVLPLWLAKLGFPFARFLFRMESGRPLYTWVSLRALQGNPRVSHAKAARELGYHPRPISRTVEDTINWFARHKPAPAVGSHPARRQDVDDGAV